VNFLTIYCRSPGGDTAAALSRMAFYTIYIQSPWGDSATALAEFALREWSAVHGALMLAVFLQCLLRQLVVCCQQLSVVVRAHVCLFLGIFMI